MTDSAQLPRLTYFDFPGRGEAVRDALRIGHVAFEDVRVSAATFRELRAAGKLPTDTLPMLELPDGTRIGQSNTLLRWAGAQAGLTPTDPVEALEVESLLDCIEDYGARLSVSIRVEDEAVRASLRSALAASWLPHFYELLDRRLRDGEAWLAAGRLTVADLKAVHLLDKLINGSLTGLPTDALVAFPRVVAWRARVHDERRLRLGE